MTRHPAFWRYTAFQIPGWIIASVGGWWVHRWLDVPLWVVSGVLVVWVIKDYALFPFLRSAYELDHRLPIERLIGERGKATDQLSPDGWVRVRGELWRAKSETAATIAPGVPVEVKGIEGTMLLVGPIGPSA